MANIDDLLQQSIQAARNGDRDGAKKLLSDAVRQDPKNPRAWYLLSQVVDQPEQVRFCLNKVLEIDPQHPKARQKMAALDTGAGMDVQTPPPPVYTQPTEPEYAPEPIEALSNTYEIPQVPGYTPTEMPPAPPFEKPYKKEPIKRKQKTDLFSLWMILAMVAVLMFTCCCGTWFAITQNIAGLGQRFNQQSPFNMPIPSGPSFAPSTGGSGGTANVTLEINGNFRDAMVAWSSPDGETNVGTYDIPWVKNYQYASGTSISLMGQGATRGGNSLTCTIKIDGRVVAQKNMKGSGGMPICMYTVP